MRIQITLGPTLYVVYVEFGGKIINTWGTATYEFVYK